MEPKDSQLFKNKVRSKGNGLGSKWTVQTTKTGQSWAKVDGLRKLTVLKSKSGRSKKK